jgi:hypothetical protein
LELNSTQCNLTVCKKHSIASSAKIKAKVPKKKMGQINTPYTIDIATPSLKIPSLTTGISTKASLKII